MSKSHSKILVSACLLGEPVRYDGKDNTAVHHALAKWKNDGMLVAICPEVSGGLPVPRPPAEIQQGTGENVLKGEAVIISKTGNDVSAAFIQGAENALKLAKEYNCKYALLAARSPSCGNDKIYDGTFSGTLVSGLGTTAALLQKNGIKVFNQNQIAELIDQIS